MNRNGIGEVELVDLPVFGRPARLVSRKQLWRCTTCGRCWCDENAEISAPPDGRHCRSAGLVNFRHHQVRFRLYAGKPDWTLLRTLQP